MAYSTKTRIRTWAETAARRRIETVGQEGRNTAGRTTKAPAATTAAAFNAPGCGVADKP